MKKIVMVVMIIGLAQSVRADSTACCELVGLEAAVGSFKATQGLTDAAFKAAELATKTVADLESKLKVLQATEIGVRNATNFVAKGVAALLTKINIKSVKAEFSASDIIKGQMPWIEVDTGAFGKIKVDADVKDIGNTIKKIGDEIAEKFVKSVS